VRQTEVAGDLLGKPANTLHRLLMARMGGVFLRNKENPLEGDVFLVDEPSMLDVPLFWRLLDALKPGSRLVLTGDVDQLPSVGPGKVLSDLIQSGAVPVARLTQVYRQAAQSPIWLAAQALCQGNGSGALAQAGRVQGSPGPICQRHSSCGDRRHC
jgi:exodeoxyribonuclease V alpha subunit